jgi:hypothetical protein
VDSEFRFQDTHPKSTAQQLPLPSDAVVGVAGTRTLTRWLEEKREWEEVMTGGDPARLVGGQFADYARTMVLAAQVELSELLQELRWKPWGSERRPTDDERARAVVEFVDVMMFMGNIAALLELQGPELDRAMDAKYEVISRRRDSGTYDGRDEKCPGCGR